MVSRTLPIAQYASKSGPHRRESASVEAAAGDPGSSILFSAVTNWSMQVVDGRRNSDLSGLSQVRWVGVPPAISIPTTHDSNRRPSASQPFNHWLEPAPLLARGQGQSQTSSLFPQFQRHHTSSARPSQNHPRSGSQFAFNINEVHATSTPTSTHLLAPPSAPPPLRRRAPIALPSLSPLTPIQIHPVISFHSSPCGPDAPIYWNMSLPPSTARLAAALGGLTASRWSREVAVEPRTLTSMTVRIVGVACPVVVFPAEMGYPIRIVDVLRAVYGALCRAALESVHSRVVGDISAGGGSNSSASVIVDEASAADAIRRHFHGGVWWGGLYESTDERDVWILELHGPEGLVLNANTDRPTNFNWASGDEDRP